MSRKLKGKSGSAAMVLQLQNHGSGSAAEPEPVLNQKWFCCSSHGSAAEPVPWSGSAAEMVLQQNQAIRTKPWFCNRTRPWKWFCSRTMAAAADPFLNQFHGLVLGYSPEKVSSYPPEK
ncbi:uncharacterized protein G2W53_040110 [Senna tora]|uniref:Uncharacterized protein n=1 Tax=Senna tora TaxID=362788 RepID=A0A834W8K5_9FABA|nr:uncharacterized protein G2W53_040110 [Senna tora]